MQQAPSTPVETMLVPNLDSLKRKLHSCQVLLWLKQSYFLKESEAETYGTRAECHVQPEIGADGRCGDRAGKDEDDRPLLRKSSVYSAYLAICRRDGLNPLFNPPVLGKMVRRTFPTVETKRKGPRGRVQQYYIGLLPHHDGETASRPSLEAEIRSEVERAVPHRQPPCRKRKRWADGLPMQGNSTQQPVATQAQEEEQQSDAQARPGACPRATTSSPPGRRSSSTTRDPQMARQKRMSSASSSLPLTEIPMDAPWARIYLAVIDATYRAASHPIKMEDELVDQQLTTVSPAREAQEDDVQEAVLTGSRECDSIAAALLPRPSEARFERFDERSSEGTPEEGDAPSLHGELEDQWDWNLDLDKLEDILDSSCWMADD